MKIQMNETYPWLARECSSICKAIETGDGNTGEMEDLTYLSTLFAVRQPWERKINNAVSILKTFREQRQHLKWVFSWTPDDENCPVAITPVVAKGQPGKENGEVLDFLKYVEDNVWPSFFTQQDQIACSLLAEEMKAAPPKEMKISAFKSPHTLEALVGHPLLYWDSAFNGAPLKCKKLKPILQLQQEGEFVNLSFQSEIIGKHGTVVKVDGGTDISLYQITSQDMEIIEELGSSITLSKHELGKTSLFLVLMSNNFQVLSDINLDFLGVSSQPAVTKPVVRMVPKGSALQVSIYMQPFPENGFAYWPGEGPMEHLTGNNGTYTRYIRDLQGERDCLDNMLQRFKGLEMANFISQFQFELLSDKDCYDFTLSLYNMLDEVKVMWPVGAKNRVHRLIGMGELSLNCRKASDWMFALDGTIRINEEQVLSFRELLQAAKNKKGNYIQLENGQLLALADSFRKRLDDFASLLSLDEPVLKFNKFALPIMEKLLEGTIKEKDTSGITEKIQNINEAMELEPEVPETLMGQLRSYQQAGFTWLCRLDAWGAGACLADDMGLGKTIQVISFLLYCAEQGPALVVAPTSVCDNWLQELAQFAPSLKTISFGGLHRHDLFAELGPNTVMVSSYGLLQSEGLAFKQVDWRVAVLDEGQAIKNHNTKRSRAVVALNAKFRIVTTGTPLENNLNELWSIFNFLNPGLLGSLSSFQEKFVLSTENIGDDAPVARLAKIVKPFILRRLKKNVLKDLPPKTEVQLQVEISPEERSLYEALRRQLVEDITANPGKNGQMRIKVIAAITKLRLAACHPKLVLENSDIPSSKFNIFFDLLEELLAANHKILVFSQFVKHLALIRPELDKRCITYQYLDGASTITERKTAVEEFQNGIGNVFLISLKAGGLGLNLTAADYVIHLDPWWNPAVEDQASDRAYRIGQDKPVTIYRFITKDTIEDKILALHQSKRSMAENLLAGTDTVEKINQDELLKLLME